MAGMPAKLLSACALGALAVVSTMTGASADGLDAAEVAGSAKQYPAVDITLTGFDRPESVLYDEKGDAYLVSNITNGPRDADNTGFISRVSPDGQILDLKWIEGGVNGVTLNAPKGTTISRGVLYVADIDQLRLFDAETGAPLGSLSPPGAIFLNDVSSDAAGNVYVTDIGFTTVPSFGESGADAVYKVTKHGEISFLAAGNSLLHHPNGVAALPGGAVKVVTYDPFMGTQELFTLTKRGDKTDVVTLPTGLLDGIVPVKGGFLVSSWVDFSNATAGVIYFVGRDGTITQVAGGFQNASDIGYDTKRNRLLIPELPDPGNGGRVVIRTLTLP